MTICYFGDYNPCYTRNRILIRGLREAGATVIEVRSCARGPRRYWDLFRRLLMSVPFDVVIVGYSDSRKMVPLVRLMTRKPVVWDAFYSLYDARVFDRKLVKIGSIRAKYYWFLDWLNCFLADRILLDTDAHISYFVRTFRVPKRKFGKIMIGADYSVFYPRNDCDFS